MVPNKTQPTKLSVQAFISSLEDNQKLECEILVKLLGEITKLQPILWGKIIGFGSYHYKYPSGREGDYLRIGFAPRKSGIAIYIINGFADYQIELSKLGNHKTGVGCLNIKKLDLIDLDILKTICEDSWNKMNSKYE